MNKLRTDNKATIEKNNRSASDNALALDRSVDNPLRSADPKTRKKARRKRNKKLAATQIRTVQPALVIALGGSAGNVASRLKGHLANQETDNFAAIRVFDTDETARAGADGCPGFTDGEFVHLRTGRVKNIIQHPKSHEFISQRTGMTESGRAAFHEQLLNEGVEQAGQVRSYGHASFEADFQNAKSAIQSGLSFLKGAHSELVKQLECKNRLIIRQKMTVYVIFSNAGGTGSSMALETMALLRSLTSQLSVNLVGVMIMPSAFDTVVVGRRDQEVRIRANAYATMQELEWFRAGAGTQHNIKLGPDQRNALEVPAGLFNQMFVAGRYTADGRDLATPDAVVDTVALHLAAEIGTEISDRIEADDANEATLRGLTPDPLTGKSRFVSTLGATALSFPVGRIAKSCAARAAHAFVQNRVLGVKLDPKVVKKEAEAWAAQPLAGEAISLNADDLPRALRRYVLPNANTVIRPLFKVVNGNQRIHFRNSAFPAIAQKVTQDFQEIRLPEYEARLAEFGNSLLEDAKKSLNSRINQIAQQKGWRAAEAFCKTLADGFDSVGERLAEEADEDYARAKNAFARAKESVTPLIRWYKAWFRSRKRQNQVAQQLQQAMTAAVDGMTKLTAQRILTKLQTSVAKQKRIAADAVAGASRCMSKAKSLFDDARAGRSVTVDSLAEIDVSTPAMDAELFHQFRLDNDVILKQLRESFGKSLASVLRMVAIETEVFDALLTSMDDYFAGQLADVSVVDVLAAQLANESTSTDAEARIRQAVIGCQSLWQAESSQLGVSFSDSMIAGIPESGVSKNREAVVNSIMAAAAGRIHPNGQYQGTASHVVSGDIHRIYVIRRTHGGCLHYLPEVADCEAAYKQWINSGGHPVHIFNSEIVAKMPPIMPSSDEDGERAFAIGLAYGWIANRGPHWYWNLTKEAANKLVCRLNSHWNGIAFQNNAYAAAADGALDAFVQTGKLSYSEREDMIVTEKLGQGMDNAQREVCDNGEMIELVFDAFNDLRAVAGDARVAAELNAYAEDLKQRTKSTDQNFERITRMAELLARQVAELDNA